MKSRLYTGAVSNNALTETDETANAGSSHNQGGGGSSSSDSVCGEDKGGCEQICDDTSGRATCLCYRGYVLAEDGTTCTGTKMREGKERQTTRRPFNISARKRLVTVKRDGLFRAP